MHLEATTCRKKDHDFEQKRKFFCNLVTENKFACLRKSQVSEFEGKMFYWRAIEGDRWLVLKNPLKSTEGFSKAFLKAK